MTDDTTNGGDDFFPMHVPTDAELEAVDHRNIPSSASVIGDVRIDKLPPLRGLPPAMQQRVTEKMATVKADHAIFEEQFIREELEKNSLHYKIVAGIHSDANEYEKVVFGIEREIFHLENQVERMTAALDEVIGHRTEYDADGNVQAVPVLRYAGDDRKGREAAIRDVERQIRLLRGAEGDALKKEAAEATRAHIRDLNARLSEDREVARLTEQQVRQNRIDEKVAVRVKNRRHEMR